MRLDIVHGISIDSQTADQILVIAYDRGIIKSDDVLNGCDYFDFRRDSGIVAFHIQDSMFWEYITTAQFIECYIELLKKLLEELE